jgi:hypothetical protein
MAVELSNAEKLARAVLLFHSSGPWDKERQEFWKSLTGTYESTSKSLCNLARVVRVEEETKNSG